MLGWLTGKSQSLATVAPVAGEHNLSQEKVHKLSAGNAITPNTAPETIFDTYRAAPVHDRPVAFTEEDAEAVKELAIETRKRRKATKSVRKSHAKILKDSAEINRENQLMFRAEARFEKNTLGYKNTTGKLLHSHRPQYAQLGKSFEQAEKAADASIQALMAQL